MIFGRRYLSSNWKAPTCRILRLIEYLRSCRLVGICMRTSVILHRIQIRNYSCERANQLIDLSFSWSLHHHHLYTVYRVSRIIRTKRDDFSIDTFAKFAASLHPFLLLWVVTLTWGSLFVVFDQMEHSNKWRKALWIICPVNNWQTWWAHHVAK